MFFGTMLENETKVQVGPANSFRPMLSNSSLTQQRSSKLSHTGPNQTSKDSQALLILNLQNSSRTENFWYGSDVSERLALRFILNVVRHHQRIFVNVYTERAFLWSWV